VITKEAVVNQSKSDFNWLDSPRASKQNVWIRVVFTLD